MKHLIFFFLLLGLLACSNSKVQDDVQKMKLALITAQKTIESLEAQIEPEGNLVHMVFFKTKSDADLNAFGAEIKKLEGIKMAKDFQYGPFKELGDTRALSDYTFMMEMSFDNEADYQAYQKHPLHLSLKENANAFLAGPPATYDYIKK